MGGPVASVPLREALTDAQIMDLDQWFRPMLKPWARPWQPGQPPRWFVSLEDGKLIGLPDADFSRASGVDIALERIETKDDFREPDGWLDPRIEEELDEDCAQTVAALGYYPIQRIGLSVSVNSDINHRILGRLALLLAERYDGLIDMGGAIEPPPRPGSTYTLASYPWSTLEEISAFVQAMPGRVIERYYTTGAGRPWVSHLVDTTFMCAWLEHPHFRMIK